MNMAYCRIDDDSDLFLERDNYGSYRFEYTHCADDDNRTKILPTPGESLRFAYYLKQVGYKINKETIDRLEKDLREQR